MPDTPIIFHDIIVVTNGRRLSAPVFATGEFGRPDLFGGTIYKDEQAEQTIQRLFKHIEALITAAQKAHLTRCCLPDGSPDPCKINEITRLVTNEFYFYTATPLTIPFFERLLQEIMTLAITLPSNIHLILGTFAIKTPDNQVMNVAPFIESGKNAQLTLLVKNHPSSNDPLYNEKTSETACEILPNRNAKEDEESLPYYISINQQNYYFSFNNIILNTTLAGIQFLSCIEICLDHHRAVAKKRLTQYLNNLVNTVGKSADFKPPLFCSHIVLSNTIAIQPKKSFGVVTHADPAHSVKSAVQAANLADRTWLNSFSFGCATDILIMEPAICHYLIMQAVKSNNMTWLTYFANHDSNLNFEIISGKKIVNPILLAALKGRLNIVHYLIKNHSINPDYIQLALCYAAVQKHQSIVELLMNHGANINNYRVEGLSILDIMVYNDNIELLAYFIENGADLSRENDFKQTAIQTAENQENKKMVKFLKEMQKYQATPGIPCSSSSFSDTSAVTSYSPTTELLSHLAPIRNTSIHAQLNTNLAPDLIVFSKSKTTLNEICENLVRLYGYLENKLDINFSEIVVWEGFADEDCHIIIPNNLVDEIADSLSLYSELIIRELMRYKKSSDTETNRLEIEANAPTAQASLGF